MEIIDEKRLAKRIARHAQLEIRVHCRWGAWGQGELIDCSERGVGLYSREALKTGAIILLRVCDASPSCDSMSSAEAVPFHMITAKVHWCSEGASADGLPGYRIGVQQLQPYF
jgi:hypothetical protein